MKQATAKRRSKGCNEESLLRSKMCEQKPDEPRNKTRRGLCGVVVGNYRFLCESRRQKAGEKMRCSAINNKERSS